MKGLWAVPFFLLFFGLVFVLPFVPPMNDALRSVGCMPGDTYEWVSADSGNESSSGFGCVDAEGRHHFFDTYPPAAESEAFLYNIGAAAVLSGVPLLVVWWWRRRKRSATAK